MITRTVVTALFAVAWAGSIWLAFFAGFTCQLSVATYQSTLADRVQLTEQKRLLGQMSAGNADAVRQALENRVRLGEALVKLHEDMPEIGPMDMLFAGFHPREVIELIRAARASHGQRPSSLKASGKQA